MHKNPGVVSDTPFKQPSVSRSNLTPKTVTVPVKGGMKVVHSIPKANIKGR